MNYSQRGTINKQKQIKSRKKRLFANMSVSFLRTFLICAVICVIVGGFACVGFIKGIIDDAPSVDDINETLAHLKSRIISIQAAQDGMNQSKMMYKEDQQS